MSFDSCRFMKPMILIDQKLFILFSEEKSSLSKKKYWEVVLLLFLEDVFELCFIRQHRFVHKMIDLHTKINNIFQEKSTSTVMFVLYGSLFFKCLEARTLTSIHRSTTYIPVNHTRTNTFSFFFCSSSTNNCPC